MDPIATIAIAVGTCLALYLGYRFWPTGGPFLWFYHRDLSNPKSWGLWFGKGLPRHPDKHPEGWSFDLGGPDKEVHYLTTPYGSLKGRTRLTVNGRVEGGPIVGRGGQDSVMVMYFQRKFDDGTDGHEHYRWWDGASAISPIAEGPFEMVFDLKPVGCTSMLGKRAEDYPDEFAAAINHAGMVGLTFGGVGDGYGHGARSDGLAKVIITSYVIS